MTTNFKIRIAGKEDIKLLPSTTDSNNSLLLINLENDENELEAWNNDEASGVNYRSHGYFNHLT